MLTKDSIFVILYSLPVYQLLFYTVQLISFRRKNPSKKYLGLLLLTMTTFLVINALSFLGYARMFSYLYFIYLPVLLSVAPAYFLYILSITQENHDVKKRQRLLLFSPAIFFFIINLIFLGAMDEATRLSITDRTFLNPENGEVGIPGVLIAFWIAAVLFVFAQIVFAIIQVSKIMQSETDHMRKQPSHLAYLEWKWILGISVSVLVFLVINALVEMVVPMKNIGPVLVYNILMLLSGGITGYLGMKQDDLLNQVEKISIMPVSVEKNEEPAKDTEEVPISTTEILSKEEAEHIHRLIISYLESEKPYLNSDFSMHDLCNKLDISRRKISFVLNEVLQKNFYGVVNEYRIRDAQGLLNDESLNQMKIEALGEMVGFQSKSSFNACFKKVTGMTPSEYRVMSKVQQ
jgi:AraC-like DNA-binding protein